MTEPQNIVLSKERKDEASVQQKTVGMFERI